MPRFAANLSTLYPEFPLTDRIAAAARDGFAAVEVQSPYAVGRDEFRRALEAARMQAVLINAPQGAADAGERGLAALPGREADFEASIDDALDYARVIGAPRIHVMAGVPAVGVAVDTVTAVYRRNLAQACRAAAAHGLEVTIEPINTRDMPGYFLTTPAQAVRVIEALAQPNLRLQFDCYHAQIIGGDLTRTLQRCRSAIGHVQIAGVPDRTEPDRGEVDYRHVFAWLDDHAYAGWVGCEYRPAGGSTPGATSAGLGWMRRL